MSFKTQAEIFQALLDGKTVIYNRGYSSPCHLQDGIVVDERGIPVNYTFLDSENWSIYEEPKPKKQVWEWRYRKAGKEWYVDGILCDEIRASVLFDNFEYEKHAGPFEVTSND
jgi:hypothetical protein